MKEHEVRVLEGIARGAKGRDRTELAAYHRTRIRFLQEERLAHLLVTLAFGLMLLISVLFLYFRPEPAVGILAVLMLLLLVPYLRHYFILENTVQRWYRLADTLEQPGKGTKGPLR